MRLKEFLEAPSTVTAKMAQATAKLKTQVHKSTVAAAKAPRLELGVLGISIGQEQSTGPTSRVNE
jgi:hypothetical protein